ncbi:ankyrin repeat domain-containing protein [Bacillus sp. DX4.1]|uniref:ankyrin repeat domain-containing protein n=1 Tax=Bacillus sp. DX4.1 TaxID=3055867 RepID=UPI0025A24636|nr:ankyrin repeat domain-containing protein [Bacillus sp. DX4.1]MDM5187035.1 ankyrin repeat domain-containing protein [Bacillus sp. DX4.1]
MVRKTLSFIGAVVVKKSKMLLFMLLGLFIVMAACEEQEEAKPKTKPVQVKHEKKKEEKKGENLMDKQLLLSATLGDTETVLKLIKDGANINVIGEQGETPIMAATYHNHMETVKALIEAGADIQLQDKNKDNPFLYASAEGYLEIVKLTIEAGTNTKETNRYGTALIPAAERGHVEVVRELLTRTDIDVNYINDLGWTALLEAIVLGNGSENHKRVIQLLIENGADVNMPDREGVTPLQHAEKRGFKEMETMLRTAGANEITKQPTP